MAINPNTDFTSGDILTASQQNRFPRGIVALTTSQTNSATITTEAVTLTSTSFTAVANRYYKVTYYEPMVQPSVSLPSYMTFRIRLTNISGTVLQRADTEATGADGMFVPLQIITTFAAGATTVCGTAQAASGSLVCYGNAGVGVSRQIIVEDIGPA